MAMPGETIENPVTGERVTWIETAQSTGGELLAADLHVEPAAAVGLPHHHVRQEERFAVRSGTAGFVLAGEERTVGRGDEVTNPDRCRPSPSWSRAPRSPSLRGEPARRASSEAAI